MAFLFLFKYKIKVLHEYTLAFHPKKNVFKENRMAITSDVFFKTLFSLLVSNILKYVTRLAQRVKQKKKPIDTRGAGGPISI